MQVKVVKRKELNKLEQEQKFSPKGERGKGNKSPRGRCKKKEGRRVYGHARNAQGKRVAHPQFSFSLPLSNAFHAASKETLAKFKVSLYASSMLVTNWR